MAEAARALVPAKSTHAIQNCTFVAELAAPLSAALLSRVSERYERSDVLRGFLPRKNETRGGMVVGVMGPQQVNMQQLNELQAVTFERIAPDGTPEWTLVANATGIALACAVYSRWQAVSTQALLLLAEALSVLPEVRLSGIGLQYVDEFFWLGPEGAFRAEEIFRPASPLLMPRVYEIPDLWHNHVGWYEMHTDPPAFRELINVNVSLLDQPERLVAQLMTTHRALLPEPAQAAEVQRLAPYWEVLHQSNKRSLRQLLSNPVCELIALRGN